MFRNVKPEAPMGGPILFWGLMLSVSAICIWSTYGESKYLVLINIVFMKKMSLEQE